MVWRRTETAPTGVQPGWRVRTRSEKESDRVYSCSQPCRQLARREARTGRQTSKKGWMECIFRTRPGKGSFAGQLPKEAHDSKRNLGYGLQVGSLAFYKEREATRGRRRDQSPDSGFRREGPSVSVGFPWFMCSAITCRYAVTSVNSVSLRWY